MKNSFLLTFLGAGGFLVSGIVTAQDTSVTPVNGTLPLAEQRRMSQQGQVPQSAVTADVSLQTKLLLANPQVLFAELDLNGDGILTQEEFNQIAALSSRLSVTTAPSQSGNASTLRGVPEPAITLPTVLPATEVSPQTPK